MCNLNIIIKNENIDETASFISCASALSYAYNPHGEGFYCDNTNKVFKSLDKIDFYKYKEGITNSKVILIHERLSTGGDGLENTHPFENKNFVLIHNGVFSSFIENHKENKSDTAFFFKKFNSLFKKYQRKNKGMSREKIIKQIIKELLDKNGESWSIAIYDKIEKITYYFKNRYTKIYGYKNHNYLYLTTNDDNEKFLTIMKREYKPMTIKDNVIYKIYISPKDNTIKMEMIGLIKEEVYSYKWDSGDSWEGLDKKTIKKNNQDYEDFKKNGFQGFELGEYEENDESKIEKEFSGIGIDSLIEKERLKEFRRKSKEEGGFFNQMLKEKLDIVKIRVVGECGYCGDKTRDFSNNYGDFVCPKCREECYDEFLHINGIGVDDGYYNDFDDYKHFSRYYDYNDFDEYEKKYSSDYDYMDFNYDKDKGGVTKGL